MAKKNIKTTKVEVCVTSNENYCGIGAGGVQFAYGKAVIEEGNLADWYREHKGYEVTPIDDDLVKSTENNVTEGSTTE